MRRHDASPSQQPNHCHNENSCQREVQRQAERTDGHALLDCGRVEQVLLAKEFEGYEQHADADLAAREHANAQRQAFAQSRFISVCEHRQAFSEVAHDREKNHMGKDNDHAHSSQLNWRQRHAGEQHESAFDGPV